MSGSRSYGPGDILGWTAESEAQQLKASAARLWTFEDSKDEVAVGEFAQTDLKGYLDSREASLRHAATISQTPAHELLGQMVNLSAEALVAAEASQRRKITEREMSFGESWEQVLALAGRIQGVEQGSGAVTRHVLDGGRETMVAFVRADRRALGARGHAVVPMRGG